MPPLTSTRLPLAQKRRITPMATPGLAASAVSVDVQQYGMPPVLAGCMGFLKCARVTCSCRDCHMVHVCQAYGTAVSEVSLFLRQVRTCKPELTCIASSEIPRAFTCTDDHCRGGVCLDVAPRAVAACSRR